MDATRQAKLDRAAKLVEPAIAYGDAITDSPEWDGIVLRCEELAISVGMSLACFDDSDVAASIRSMPPTLVAVSVIKFLFDGARERAASRLPDTTAAERLNAARVAALRLADAIDVRRREDASA
jgi:hypothetical protein